MGMNTMECNHAKIQTVYQKAKTYVDRNARPLDLMRWKFHFEKGSATQVLEALAAYQNEDGGFGHGLEPDSFNPESAPIQTWCATELLYEIGHTDGQHAIVKGILNYLDSGKDYRDGYWLAEIPSNNDYPHAPWWSYEENSIEEWGYNPTIALAGFALRYAKEETSLYAKAKMIAKTAVKEFLKGNVIQNDMHELACFLRFCDYVELADQEKEQGLGKEIQLEEVKSLCAAYVKKSICKNIEEWSTTYTAYPSNFMMSRTSSLYEENKELADYECKFILDQQLEDGSYSITWNWSDYANEWAIAKNWWKVNRTILNMQYLKGFGYFEESMQTSEIELKPVTRELWYDCVCLQVDQSQKHFVAANSFSLAQAAYEPELYPYAIYAKENLVGFLMYGYDSDIKMWGLCRLMIDRRYQKNGYGRAALEQLFQMVTKKLGQVQFFTSYEPDNEVAGKLYASLGFVDTGKIIEGEKFMIKQL